MLNALYALAALLVLASAGVNLYEWTLILRARRLHARQLRAYKAAVDQAVANHSPTEGCECWACRQARAIKAQGGATRVEGSESQVVDKLSKGQL